MDIHQNEQVWATYDWPNRGEEWSEGWGGAESQWFGCIFPRIHKYLPATRILEIAPGYGRWTQFLKNQCSQLTVVDLVPDCIEYSRNRFAEFTHISYHVNDGKSLAMIPDGSIDFVFSFDSLVHADVEVIESYLGQLSHKLARDGVGFVHHSNLGDYVGQHVANRHGRDPSVSAKKVSESCRQVGLTCISQEIVNWGQEELVDCLSVFTRVGSSWERPNVILRNPNFMREAAFLRSIAPLYHSCSVQPGDQCADTSEKELGQTSSGLQAVTTLQEKLSRLEGKLAEVEGKLAEVTTRLNRYLDFPIIDAVRRFRRTVLRLPPRSNT